MPLLRPIFITLALLTALCLHPAAAADRKPNILLLYVDDMGWAQPGCYGGKMAPTPHIDSLAQSGIRFTDGYSSGCICSPGRVGLMTGRYQARTGHDGNPNRPGTELLLSETTMAQRMKAAGYTTGIVGKWHLGDTRPEYLPTARGFDYAIGSVGNLGEGKGPGFYRGAELITDLAGAPITSPVYAREAIGFMERSKDQPWFLYLAFNAVHAPHVASAKWLEKFKNLPKHDQQYAALVAEADEAIGDVIAKLRELKQEQDTLIFLISDNGGAYANAEMGGLRGHKWFCWEGGIRVSWLAAWPGHIPANRVSHEPVIQLDVLPTALAAAGARHSDAAQFLSAQSSWTPAAPSNNSSTIANQPSTTAQPLQSTAHPPSAIAQQSQLDGINLLPLLEGKTETLAPRALYFRFGVQHAVREGDWKLVKASKDMEPMLINLATDPGEQTDLSATNPEKKQHLQTLFDQWNATMQPPRWIDLRWNGDENHKAVKKERKTGKTVE